MNHFKAAVFLCGYGGSREVMLCRFAGRLTHETIIRKPAIPTPSPIGQSVSERCLGRQNARRAFLLGTLAGREWVILKAAAR